MWRATLPNRKPIKQREKEVKKSVDKKNKKKPFEFTKTDIFAMIIAAFQIIMPIVFLGAIIYLLFVLFFTKVILK